jgi:hypothetical protein
MDDDDGMHYIAEGVNKCNPETARSQSFDLRQLELRNTYELSAFHHH